MNTLESLPKNTQIILFDGVCNLCSGAVQFIIERDKNNVFRFASLQSDLGKQLLAERRIDPKKTDSIILIQPNVAYYIKSSAALQAAKKLSGYYSYLRFLLIIPTPIRDWVYDFIAKNRYKWFGKKEACWIPTPELKSLFLDMG